MFGYFSGVSKVGFHFQGQHDELEAKFFEERAALEAKYQKLYQPLYTKVYLLVYMLMDLVLFFDHCVFIWVL